MTWIQFKTQGNTWRSIGGGIQGERGRGSKKNNIYTACMCIYAGFFWRKKKR